MVHQARSHPWSNLLAGAVEAQDDAKDVGAAENHPSPAELDVWTNEMDRKTRKRIQNRVAQRTYRREHTCHASDLDCVLS